MFADDTERMLTAVEYVRAGGVTGAQAALRRLTVPRPHLTGNKTGKTA